jgi:hypothetical protein
MPTGYTAVLCEKGQSFQDFAIRCAHAFGALIELRDEPLDAPIPDNIGDSSYYEKALAGAIAKRDELAAMTPEQAAEHGRQLREQDIQRLNKTIAEHIVIRDRLAVMVKQVKGWLPPTKDHDGLKKFMLQQLETSSSDGDPSYFEKALAGAKERSAEDYHLAEVRQAEQDIEYYRKKAAEDDARNKERREWISALRQSLAGDSHES